MAKAVDRAVIGGADRFRLKRLLSRRIDSRAAGLQQQARQAPPFELERQRYPRRPAADDDDRRIVNRGQRLASEIEDHRLAVCAVGAGSTIVRNPDRPSPKPFQTVRI